MRTPYPSTQPNPTEHNRTRPTKSEYDNGRLLRLLLKLGTLNERPDQGGGTGEWAETGERYILKLFRDYLFHQVRPGAALLCSRLSLSFVVL